MPIRVKNKRAKIAILKLTIASSPRINISKPISVTKATVEEITPVIKKFTPSVSPNAIFSTFSLRNQLKLDLKFVSINFAEISADFLPRKRKVFLDKNKEITVLPVSNRIAIRPNTSIWYSELKSLKCKKCRKVFESDVAYPF
jgi:hypothetical protein